ncbi:hypothetical protein HJC23_011905 [Cyclotella cryptica]|uniref:PROP1-like PPR domain-containing protein n=1 Tax=Cyclotella cryptica TaxID=29204 RepID=A0ABD3PJR8_9STRA|eukprot:CCRYP_013857-RA/>CCRYP_013857-RA protein AED:0.04 eAED:0.04 QI:248/1/1/1/1/1/5/246/1186
MLRRHHNLCSSWHLRFLFPTTKRRPRSSLQGCHRNSCHRFPRASDGVHKLPLISHDRHRRLSTSINHSRNATKEPVSEAQRRSAQLELEQMTQSTSRLLAIEDSALISDAIVNQARVALHYWSRRWYMHFHPGFGRAAKGSALTLEALRTSTFGHFEEQMMRHAHQLETDVPVSTVQNMTGDYGARQAEILLDWSISHNLVPRGIFNQEGVCSPLDYDFNEDYGNSPNMTCVNIIDTYLLPCAYNGVGGFNYSNQEQINLLVGENEQRHYATLSKHYTKNPRYIKAVVDATRVVKKMRELQVNFPDHISPDTLSIKSELNVWSKRSMTLGADHIGGQTGGILAGNIIAGHSNNIVPKEVLKTMENNDAIDDDGDVYTIQGCLREMEAVLTRAEEQYLSTKDDSITPSVDWYNHVLGSWARSDLKEATNRSRQILRGMEAFDGVQEENSDSDFRPCWASPDIISYNSVLFCLARDASEARAKEALELFQALKNRYQHTKNEDIRPDEVTYGTVLHALAQVGMAREAEQILDTIEEEYGASGTVIPSLTIYNTVLNAWANSFERSAPRRAEFLLARMKSLSSTGKNPDIEPDTVSISTVMSCHARSKTREGAERAEELLDQAIKSYSMGNAKVKPDSIMFNCAILGWAHCSSSNDGDHTRGKIPAERAEMLLQKLRTLRENNTLDIHPMAQTFNIVLDSWAKSERKDAASRAVALLREMPEVGVTPDECSYNSVLHAISKQEDPTWVKRAEEIFQETIRLNSMGMSTISAMTYNVMMNVYGKSSNKDGAERAEELLRTMEKLGILPGIISYNSCIDAYARRGDYSKAESLIDEMISLAEQGREECRPTIHSFAALVNAISNSKAPDTVDRAEDIVRKVEELDFVRPNTVLYNSLINTIVKSGKANSSERADRVLKRMEKVRQSGNSDVNPDSFAYSMVLTLCARSKEPDAAVRASNILDSMEHLYSQGHTKVVANSRCYSAVITAWARSGSPDTVQQAFALIDRMEQNKRIGSPHGTPNAHCYNACIHAIAKSSESDKVKYCLDILQRMNDARDAGDFESAPTLVTYSTILNACAYTTGNEEERKKAFELARTCLLTLLDSKELEPDESTFANLFLVICRHLGKGEARDRFAEAVFREACRQGKVERQVLYHFRNASPSSATKLLSGYDSDAVPEEWSRNVGKFKKKA